jgi:uncharacterized RmlC-like cupin family protein
MARRVRPEDFDRQPGQTEGMERAIAINADIVGSIGLYSSIVTTPPGGATKLHHHGPCETSIFILRGKARFSAPNQLFEAHAGDFVYIPAGELHVEENASRNDLLVVLVTRNCRDAVTIYLE